MTATSVRTVELTLSVKLAVAKTGKVVEEVTTTREHPFYVSGKGFVAAGGLSVGNAIVTRAGPALVVADVVWQRHRDGVAVYNFTVEDDHTYFVGKANGGLWVHNNVCVWDHIRPTQPVYPGTVIPRSFEISAESGNSFWVHGNATGHLAEYAAGMAQRGSSPSAINLASQVQLTSLHSAISAAEQQGIAYGQIMHIGGWELQFAPPRQAGQLPALIHALMR